MARGLPGGLSAGRELLDRLARQLPVRLTVGTFIGAIGAFTVLLSMPWATASGQRAPFVDALFTATSAVSVTGLVTVPTGAYWSTGGQVTILAAIKLGGLAVMTLASILALAVSRSP
jgi:trk system potassium uptake protein TrkH